jgi:3-oxoadipate CoA-transferase alpha subunit
MIDKLVASLEEAVADIIVDGASIMIGGFGSAGMPTELIDALLRQGSSWRSAAGRHLADGCA